MGRNKALLCQKLEDFAYKHDILRDFVGAFLLICSDQALKLFKNILTFKRHFQKVHMTTE